MSKQLTLGSLFDGSGGFPLGGLLCGIHPVWASEIEPFPIRVTTKRLPWVRHLGDISCVNGAEIPPVDIITFGSPCTDLSIAGRRDGLGGKQSSLFFQAIRIIKEMREATNGTHPRFIAWENVPGAYSSNEGADFGEVLTQIARIAEPEAPAVPVPDSWPDEGLLLGDGWSLAYRTLDAQWWVPQRRKRIYAVADFGSERAADILFERQGVSRNLAQGGFPWQGAPGGAESSPGGAVAFEPGAVARLRSPHYYDEAAGTLRAHMGDNRAAVAYSIGAYDSGGMKSANPHAGIYETDTARTIDGNGGNPSAHQGGVAVVEPKTLKIRSGCDGGGKGPLVQNNLSATLSTSNDQTLFVPVAFAQNQRGELRDLHDCAGALAAEPGVKQQTYIAYGVGNGQANQQPTPEQAGTLNCMHDQQAVCVDCRNHRTQDISGALQAKSTGGHSLNFINPVVANYVVRRLTPRECAKLQGFPPDWCEGLGTPEPTEEDIAFWAEVFETHWRIMGKSSKPKSRNQIVKWLRNPYSDSKAYAMWGNGVALPVVVYVLLGIVELTQDVRQ